MTNLFKPKVETPKPQPVAALPDADLANLEGRRQARLDAMGRAGRRSTILTDPRARRDGGMRDFDTYAAKTLGGA